MTRTLTTNRIDGPHKLLLFSEVLEGAAGQNEAAAARAWEAAGRPVHKQQQQGHTQQQQPVYHFDMRVRVIVPSGEEKDIGGSAQRQHTTACTGPSPQKGIGMAGRTAADRAAGAACRREAQQTNGNKNMRNVGSCSAPAVRLGSKPAEGSRAAVASAAGGNMELLRSQQMLHDFDPRSLLRWARSIAVVGRRAALAEASSPKGLLQQLAVKRLRVATSMGDRLRWEQALAVQAVAIGRKDLRAQPARRLSASPAV